MASAALGALAGLAASIALYAFFPLPASAVRWQNPRLWISLLLLGGGLSCSVVLLITGLIVLLNRGSDEPPHEEERRR